MSIIYDNSIKTIVENNIKILLNANNILKEKLSKNDPRSIGKLIEEITKRNLDDIFPINLIKEKSTKSSRKSMDDFCLICKNNFRHIIDIKTHRLDSEFNMPNITSIEKLNALYKSENNYFSIIMVKYNIVGDSFVVEDVIFSPIEYIDFNCLRIGALGKDQLQLKNSSNICFLDNFNRGEWISRFKLEQKIFYKKQINKFQKLYDSCS